MKRSAYLVYPCIFQKPISATALSACSSSRLRNAPRRHRWAAAALSIASSSSSCGCRPIQGVCFRYPTRTGLSWQYCWPTSPQHPSAFASATTTEHFLQWYFYYDNDSTLCTPTRLSGTGQPNHSRGGPKGGNSARRTPHH